MGPRPRSRPRRRAEERSGHSLCPPWGGGAWDPGPSPRGWRRLIAVPRMPPDGGEAVICPVLAGLSGGQKSWSVIGRLRGGSEVVG